MLMQVDILNTEAHNTRLADTLKLLDAELNEKVGVVMHSVVSGHHQGSSLFPWA